jgi:hypothetical protein
VHHTDCLVDYSATSSPPITSAHRRAADRRIVASFPGATGAISQRRRAWSAAAATEPCTRCIRGVSAMPGSANRSPPLLARLTRFSAGSSQARESASQRVSRRRRVSVDQPRRRLAARRVRASRPRVDYQYGAPVSEIGLVQARHRRLCVSGEMRHLAAGVGDRLAGPRSLGGAKGSRNASRPTGRALLAPVLRERASTAPASDGVAALGERES